MGNLCKGDAAPEPLQEHTLEDAFFQNHPTIKHTLQHYKIQIPANWHINRRLVTEIPGQGHYLGKRNASTRSGYGIMLYERDGEALYYVGNWHGNCKQGLGIMLDAHGSYYKGEWAADEPNGYGEYYHTLTGRYYKGKWKNAKKEGLGEQGFANGTKFVGNFKDDLKHGYGKLFFKAKGCYFQGVWEKDKIVGTGKQRGADYLYVGPWVDGQMHGTAKCTYYGAQGEVVDEYVGQFERGLKHGYGEYRWAKGSVYKGQWVKGRMVYQGLFVVGK